MKPTTLPTGVFRDVPRTGVIYVMTEANARGFAYGDNSWANFGQGAPETGEISDAPERIAGIEIDVASHEYAPVAGVRELREAVANLYNARYRKGKESQYTWENVAISGGGRLALSRLAAAMGRTHIGHLVPDYTAYEELLELFESFSTIPIPLDPARSYALSASELRREFIGRGMGALLFSNPANPTGRLVAGEQLSAWVDVAREVGSYLLIDEFYSHYIWDPAASINAGVSGAACVEDVNSDPVVLIDGLTKNWRYPGWRIGWTVGPKSLIERVASVGSFLDGGPPHPLQKAAIPLLSPERADAVSESIRRQFGPKRDWLLKGLARLGITIDAAPSGSFYVWGSVARLPESINTGMKFFRAALDHKVIVVPGEFFDVNPGQRRQNQKSQFEQYVRFSFGPSMESLEPGLERLAQMIEAASA